MANGNAPPGPIPVGDNRLAPPLPSSKNLTLNLPLRRISIEPLEGVFSHRLVPTIALFATFGRAIHLFGSNYERALVYATAFSEVFAALTPAKNFMEKEDMEAARAVFVRDVRQLLLSPLLEELTTLTRADYVRLCKMNGGRSNINLGVEVGRMQPEDWPMDINVGLQPMPAMRLLCAVAFYAHPRYHISHLCVVAHSLLASLKRGNISRAALNEIERTISQELGEEVQLNCMIIQYMHTYFCCTVDDNRANLVKSTLEVVLPPSLGKRLVTLLLDASGTRLKTYHLIREATDKYPEFPWKDMYKLLPLESEALQITTCVVNKNIWMELRNDLRVLRGIHYRGLGYIARQLLIELGNRQDLVIQDPHPRTFAHANMVERAVNNFINNYHRT